MNVRRGSTLKATERTADDTSVTSTWQRRLPRSQGLLSLGAGLAALEGVLAVTGGVGFALLNVFADEPETSFTAIAAPITSIAFGILLLRASSAIQETRSDRDRLDPVAIGATALGQLAIGLPLLWFTLSDPVDARTNVLLTAVALGLVASGTSIVLNELAGDDTGPVDCRAGR